MLGQLAECAERHSRAAIASRGGGRVSAWFILVIITQIFLAFSTGGIAEACGNGKSPAWFASQASAHSPLVRQNAAYDLAKYTAVASSFVAFAARDNVCCGDPSGHCQHHAATSCCTASTAGVMNQSSLMVWNGALPFDVPSPQAQLSSLEPDTQFRPPRSSL
jgi:hypothetical protein